MQSESMYASLYQAKFSLFSRIAVEVVKNLLLTSVRSQTLSGVILLVLNCSDAVHHS